MRAVVQRVKSGAVSVGEETVGKIGRGLVVLLGVGQGDGPEDARYLAEKTVHLRIFEDEAGKLNLSVKDVGGEILVISQFTLFGDCRHGRRPSFMEAAAPKEAEQLYKLYVQSCREQGVNVATGVFQAEMLVSIANHGPVTILLDSKKLF